VRFSPGFLSGAGFHGVEFAPAWWFWLSEHLKIREKNALCEILFQRVSTNVKWGYSHGSNCRWSTWKSAINMLSVKSCSSEESCARAHTDRWHFQKVLYASDLKIKHKPIGLNFKFKGFCIIFIFNLKVVFTRNFLKMVAPFLKSSVWKWF
jgi:hypothetical protein